MKQNLLRSKFCARSSQEATTDASSDSPVEIRAPSDRVVGEVLGILFVPKVFERVGPQQVAHGPERRWFLEPVQLLQISEKIYKRSHIFSFHELLRV